MYSSEIITGDVVKQWFINAYINLQKHQDLLQNAQDKSDDLKDSKTCSYVLKNIVDAIDNIPDNADNVWVFDVATEIAKNHIVGVTATEFYNYLLLANDYIKSEISPVDFITIIENLSKNAKKELINIKETSIGDIFIKANSYCEYLDSPLDISSVCQCLIASSQELLVESCEYLGGIPDVKIAIACIIFHSLLQAWQSVKEPDLSFELEQNTDVIAQMITDMVTQAEGLSHNDNTDIFEISYKVETDEQSIDKLTKKIANTNSKGVVVGKTDIFGLGTWNIDIKTTVPLAVLPMNTMFTNFTLRTLKPIQLQSYMNITENPNSTIKLFEAINAPTTTKQIQVNVIACLNSLSLAQPVARTNAQIISSDTDTNLLKAIIEGSNQGYTILMPSNYKSFQTLHSLTQFSDKREQIIIAPTKNELEVKYLCEEIASTSTLLVEKIYEKQGLEEYINKALTKIRTVQLDSEDENIDTDIRNFIFNNSKQITFLVNDKEAIFLSDRLEHIAYTANSQIQVEILVGSSEGITILVQE